jgi:phospholipid/cholesterol/gamma-HCH transport system substrate-binding protein
MTAGIKTRLFAFLVLSAVGIVYVAGSYLGIVDRVLGRGYTIHATLPGSGGLFEGSEVTYRGFKIGKVANVSVDGRGIRLDLAIKEGTEIPKGAPIFVHNLSAVGEQYLDIEPADASGPYLQDGDTLAGTPDSLPVDEGDLLVQVDQMVRSVNKKQLSTVIHELGLMFNDTGRPLQTMLDSGSKFIDEASQHQPQTVALLQNSLTVLRTQRDEGDNIRVLAHNLNLITRTLKDSDSDLRGVIQGTPGTARQLNALLTDLEPTLPVLLGNAVSVNQVVVSHLAGLEQVLVTFPRIVSSGFTGTPEKGGGRVNMQFSNKVQPCTEGYKPESQWRGPGDWSDGPIYPARCTSPPPYNMRGTKYAPGYGSNNSPGRSYGSSYDPITGEIAGVTDGNGDPVRLRDPGNLSVLGGDSWKWLLVGPVTQR